MRTRHRFLKVSLAALFTLGCCYHTANALPAPTHAPSTFTSVESPGAKITETNDSTVANATLNLESKSGASASTWVQSPNYSASPGAERSGSKSKLIASGLALLAIGAPVVLFTSRGHGDADHGTPVTTSPGITNPGPGDPPDPIDEPIVEPPTYSDPEPAPITLDETSLPEPGTLSLLGAGLAALVAFRRRR